MNGKQICGLIVALCVAAIAARADSLELKNGSLIKGIFMGGTQTSITVEVGSSVQSSACRSGPPAENLAKPPRAYQGRPK